MVEAEITAGTITYQWQYYDGAVFTNLADGGVYSGTTTKTLSVTGVDNTLAELLYDSDNSDGVTSALFKCIISANGCDVSSNNPVLYVTDPPLITADSEDITVCDKGSGADASFSVTSSINNVSYQWQVDDGTGFVDITNDTIYSGSTSKSLTLTAAPSGYNNYLYRCEVGACSTPVYSAAASLTIDVAPVITQDPVLINTCEGSDAIFTVEVTGDNLVYQWQVRTPSGSYSDILVNDAEYNAFDGTLTVIEPSINMNNYSYRCVISSANLCDVTSGGGGLKVYAQPTLTLATNNQTTVCNGESTILRVYGGSSGFSAGVLTYQWQTDNGIGVFGDMTDDIYISGTNSKTLIIDSAMYAFNGL